ncbi:3-beta hydroxysteroid dehydrogenase [Adhaeribacter aerolatus]|uniref:3-beta hydroxysteroid dehydrogenase n=1 Tax=Adhaeribacter aerolatus TaxID=670289 RepID=A0A512AZN0_9BACT|nr:NAD(P)H-binding protein [Adhaeribacter aerolatus]GEO05164.1 3-beta hydroxysteroid dehydrogenase [Adhaeribacter aerolatus]
MKVALIGAGFVGSAVLKELTDRGHEVKVLVRHPEKVKAPNGKVSVVATDATQPDQVAEQVKGADAVISTYNAGWTNPNLYNDFLAGSKAIQEGVKKSGVKRFITVGGAGSLYVGPDTQLVDTPQFPADYKTGALAARDYLNILKKEQELDWTFLSPAIEMHQGTSGERKGTYRTGLENPVFDQNGRSIASVEDTAVAIVDELENPKHIRQRFTAAY